MCSGSTIPCGCGCSSGLGLVANSKRSIKSGSEYDKYFQLSGVTGTERQVAHGTQKRSLAEMEKIVKRTLHQTRAIAPKLKGTALITTLSKIWHFVYDHIQYTLDKDDREQLREPARTWRDRAHGVDCDCYSIFISSILHNLGIPHAFRMTKYGGDWQHVYIVVPKDGKKTSLEHRHQYYVVDPVVDSFNYEVPFTEKHDRFMSKMPITVLSGFGQTCTTKELVPKTLDYIPAKQVYLEGKVVTEQLLSEMRVPYTVTRVDGQPTIQLNADGEPVKLPTIITRDEAEVIKTAVQPVQNPGLPSEPGEILTTTDTKKAGIGNGWIIALAVTAIGFVVLSANKPGKGLSGAPKASGKKKKSPTRKPAKRKKTVSRKPKKKVPRISI